jgi:AcrR family transcriptional regulator
MASTRRAAAPGPPAHPAARVPSDEGIQAVGIQRLIDEAGIAKASLYAHFPSKDDLVAAYLERKGGEWRREVQQHLDNPRLGARGKILKIFDMVVAMVESPGFRGCPFHNASAEVADPAHPIRVAAKAQRAWVHDVMARLVRETGAASPERLAGSLMVLFDGASATALIDGDPGAARQARWAAERMLS